MSLRGLFRRALAAAIVCIAGLAGALPAAADLQKPSIGIFLADIHNLDFAIGKFTADFWIWSVAPADRPSPLDTLYVVNEVGKSAEPLQTTVVADKRWDQRRVRSDLWANWQVSRFPFDRQTLTIVLEESIATTADLVYTLDGANSAVNPQLDIPGWSVVGWEVKAEEHPYASNFGNPANPEASKFTRLVLSLTVQRHGVMTFVDMTIGAFAAFGVLVLSFRLLPIVPPIFGARMVIIVASMFTVMTSMRVYASSYAFSFGETLPTRIHLVTLAAGFLAALCAVIARYRVEKGEEEQGLRLDRRSMTIFAIAYVLVVGGMTLDAILFH